jgi:hypothetical protein
MITPSEPPAKIRNIVFGNGDAAIFADVKPAAIKPIAVNTNINAT